MFDAQDLKQIQENLSNGDTPLSLTLHSGGDDDFFQALQKVAESIVSAAGKDAVFIKKGDGTYLPGVPGLEVSGAFRGTINYLALPEGPEKVPFLEMLKSAESAAPNPRIDELRTYFEDHERTVHLMVFIAAACPHCPQSVQAVVRLVRSCPNITATVIDAQRFSKLAEQYQIKSVPTTVLDQDLWLTGVTAEDKLVENILIKGTKAYQDRILQSLIDSVRFEEAIEFLQKPNGDGSYLTLWETSTTSLRMGLMLLAEKVLAQNGQAFHGIVSGLIAVLKTEDPALRGDTADLLGQIGHPDAKEPLEQLLKDPNPDVAEIAAEALGIE